MTLFRVLGRAAPMPDGAGRPSICLFGAGIDRRTAIIVCALLAAYAVAAFSASQGLFIIDELIYQLMAEAARKSGSVTIDNGIDGFATDLLKLLLLRDGVGGLVPQYPSGYAFLAAPIYALLGARGLILLNAVAFVGVLAATYALGRRIEVPKRTAVIAVLILAFGTYSVEYAFAIWPHALSMAIVGASILAIVAATRDREDAGRSLALALAGGLVVSIGATIRADSVLVVPPVLLWLLAYRGRWRYAACYFVGLLPGLFLASWLNYLKFGIWLPVSYGSKAGATALANYWPLVPFGAAAVLIALAFSSARLRAYCSGRTALFLATALAALIFAVDATRTVSLSLLHGAYVLLVDLQTYTPRPGETGVWRDGAGHLVFYGAMKRALLQSLPYIGLAPVLLLLKRRKHADVVGLFCLIIACWVAPFALRDWHGGMSFNMRYFLPILPLIAVLTAMCLEEIAAAIGPSGRWSFDSLARIAIAAQICSLLIVLGVLARQSFGWTVALYGPLALAGLLALASALVVLSHGRLKETAARAAQALAIISLVWAGVSAYAHDLFRSQFQRFHIASWNAEAAELDDGVLVLTEYPERFLPQFLRPESVVAMIRGKIDPRDRGLVDYHLSAGRKVYVDGPDLAERLLAAFGAPAYRATELTVGDVRLVQLRRPDPAD